MVHNVYTILNAVNVYINVVLNIYYILTCLLLKKQYLIKNNTTKTKMYCIFGETNHREHFLSCCDLHATTLLNISSAEHTVNWDSRAASNRWHQHAEAAIWKREFPIGPWDQVCKSSKALSVLVSSIKAVHITLGK